MTQAELRRLARIGAEARLEALQGEIEAIYRTFPDLRRQRGKRATENGQATRAVPSERRRPVMSREARQRIAAAQRKRWAAWRKQQGNAKEGNSAAAQTAAAAPSRKKR